jgi:hypothetical protein
MLNQLNTIKRGKYPKYPNLPQDAAQCKAVHPFTSRKLILTPAVKIGVIAQS